MIKVIIDNVEFETLTEPSVALLFDARRMDDIKGARECVDVEVEIASGEMGLPFFGGEGYLHVAQKFNDERHVAQICFDNLMVFEGTATMRSARRSGDEVIYTLRVRRSGAQWAEDAARNLLSELDVDYQTYLNEYNIEQGWSSDDIVKFFPVHRDSYSNVYSQSSSDVVNRVLSVDTYHPFINIYKVIDKIFSDAGYSVESYFLESSWFKRLYMSGAYKSQRSLAAASTMDFYVAKLEDTTAVADYRGRVSMTPYIASNSVGNFVDVESIDLLTECYSRSSCFTAVDGVACFTPLTQVSVGFEYRFKYRT